MSNIIELKATINFDDIQKTIDNALKLEDNNEVFYALTGITKTKSEIKDLLEKIEKVERDTKGLINNKAKALYGNDWQTIAGEHYKITRYNQGPVYSRIEGSKIAKKFIKIVESLNTEAIDEELEKTSKLPTGLDFNDSRTEVIKVTLR